MGRRLSGESLMANPAAKGAASRGYAVYFNHPGAAVVTWDPTLKAVYVDVQGWADLIELAALLEAGLQALTEHRGSRWLVDDRNVTAIKKSDQDWIVEEFVPRALAAGLTRIALVITNERARTTVDQLVGRMPAPSAEVAYFATLDEARSWLTEPPHHPLNGAEANTII
jgi:hypothetical protein